MLLNDFLSRVDIGQKFNVNFEHKSIKLNGKKIEIDDILPDENPIEKIEQLYHQYKYSLPSEKSMNNANRSYFKALDINDMTDEELVSGIPREYARALLETYLLYQIIYGTYKWFDDNKWFWISSNEPDLVILKKWVIN